MKNKNYIVVGIGELLWDIFPKGKKLGGAPANFAHHAQQLGAHSFIVSAIGKDNLGNELLKVLKDLNLKIDYISVLPNYPTGTVIVNLDKNGVPEFTIEQGVSWDYIPFNNALFDLAKRTNAVCFGSLAQRSEVSRRTIQKFLKSTPKTCLRIFDINLRQNFYSIEIIEESLLIADCLKINDKELSILSTLFNLKGVENVILKKIMDKYELKLIALTKGAQGSKLITSNQISEIKASKMEIFDTVGAGDAFTSALVLGMLKKQSLDKIHKNADKLASFVCSQEGATPKIPSEIKDLFN